MKVDYWRVPPDDVKATLNRLGWEVVMMTEAEFGPGDWVGGWQWRNRVNGDFMDHDWALSENEAWDNLVGYLAGTDGGANFVTSEPWEGPFIPGVGKYPKRFW